VSDHLILSMLPLLFALTISAAIIVGGMVGIKFKDRLHLVISFTSGVLLGVVFFHIITELFELIGELGISSTSAMLATILGFLAIHTLEKSAAIHHAHEHGYADHHHPHVGTIGALGLAFHIFLDGMGIALAFQVSPEIGFLVAIAVIAHAFSDGLNTVSILLINRQTVKNAFVQLLLTATAPVLGVLATFFFQIPQQFLVIYLGFFSGFLLYIGASDLLPEAHRSKSSYGLIALTALGALLMFLLSFVA
jgi:zinc transporter ZupT